MNTSSLLLLRRGFATTRAAGVLARSLSMKQTATLEGQSILKTPVMPERFDNGAKKGGSETATSTNDVFKDMELTESILDVADLLESAKEHLSKHLSRKSNKHNSSTMPHLNDLKKIVDEVEAMESKLLKLIFKDGKDVKPFGKAGEMYDSCKHECSCAPVQEEKGLPHNVVDEVLKRGWFVGDRLVRSAKVKVTIPPEDPHKTLLEREVKDEHDEADMIELLKEKNLREKNAQKKTVIVDPKA